MNTSPTVSTHSGLLTLLTAWAVGALTSTAAEPAASTTKPPFRETHSQQSAYAHDHIDNSGAKASGILGMTVKHPESGLDYKIEDLVVDVESGRLVALVLSAPSRGTNAVEFRAIPATLFHYSKPQGEMRLDTATSMIQAAPHFTAEHWPDFSQGSQLEEVYRAYRVESLFSTNLTANANRSTLRARERDAQTKTAFKQGENKKDLAITAKIRRGIVAREHMSVAAKNVTIVTHQGQVTLRGWVTSAAEKEAVGEIAAGVAQLSNVSNQLEIQ